MAPTLIGIGFLVFIGIFVVKIYNRFVKNRNYVKDAWSNIDVFLKKRHDLIPNLVNTVKGYAQHEKETLELVIQARNAAIKINSDDINGRIASENALQSALSKLFALGEAYPDLKADTSFLKLQEELSQIESELSRSRRYYNATVRENNTYGESFPGVLFAGTFGFQEFEFFEADPTERENIEVDFKAKDD